MWISHTRRAWGTAVAWLCAVLGHSCGMAVCGAPPMEIAETIPLILRGCCGEVT